MWGRLAFALVAAGISTTAVGREPANSAIQAEARKYEVAADEYRRIRRAYDARELMVGAERAEILRQLNAVADPIQARLDQVRSELRSLQATQLSSDRERNEIEAELKQAR